MNLVIGILIWAALVLVAAIILFFGIGKLYFSSITGFTANERKDVIKSGIVALVLTISSFFFLPLLTFQIEIDTVARDLYSNAKEMIPGDVVSEQVLMTAFDKVDEYSAPYIKTVIGMVREKFLFIAGIGTLVLTVAVLILIFQIRETAEIPEEEYARKHLFIYNEKILEDINR